MRVWRSLVYPILLGTMIFCIASDSSITLQHRLHLVWWCLGAYAFTEIMALLTRKSEWFAAQVAPWARIAWMAIMTFMAVAYAAAFVLLALV